jgi:hypothetical protein
MDFFYLGLATACGFAIWGLALVCRRLQPTGGGRV